MRKLLLILVAVFSVGCSSVPTRSASTITVIGTGSTEEIAKQNGFKQAIQIVVGSVIVSEKETRSYNLVKNDIMDYSAGYIDYHNVINSTRIGSVYSVEMEVTVSQSRIAERILKVNLNPGNIKGDQMAVTYSTYLKHVNDSDNLLRQVLEAYPKFAYFIKLGNIDLKLNGDRKAVMVIPYEIQWNYRFLDAIYEVLSYSQEASGLGWRQQAPSTISMSMYTGKHKFNFLDSRKAEILNRTMGKLGSVEDNYPIIKFTFYDKYHRKVGSICDRTQGMNLFYPNRDPYDKHPAFYSPTLKSKFEQVFEPHDIPALESISSVIPEMMLYPDCIKSVNSKN